VLSGVRTNDMQFGLCGTIDRHLFESSNGFAVCQFLLLVAPVSFHCVASLK
jgi:hypothetical protein